MSKPKESNDNVTSNTPVTISTNMPDSLQEDILEHIQSYTRSGFYGPEEIYFGIENTFYEEKLDEKWVKQKISEEYAKQVQLQKEYAAETDFDRLARAFDKLNAAGIIALHKAGYTRQDGEGDCEELHEELKNNNINSSGYCFYHEQDVDRAIESGNLFIAFGEFYQDDEKAGTEIGKRVAKILREEGFTLNWDNTINTRIEIAPFKWQKRFGNDNCSKERAIRQLSVRR